MTEEQKAALKLIMDAASMLGWAISLHAADGNSEGIVAFSIGQEQFISQMEGEVFRLPSNLH